MAVKLKGRGKIKTYPLTKNEGQGKSIIELQFEGFTDVPKGFYKKEPWGLTSPASTFLVQGFQKHFEKKYRLKIIKNGNSEIKRKGRGVTVILKHSDYLSILDGLKDLNHEKNDKCWRFFAHRISTIFPGLGIKKGKYQSENEYSENKFSKIINVNEKIIDELSKTDISAISGLYSKLLEMGKIGNTVTELESLQISQKKSEKIYLDKIVMQFEDKLSKTVQREQEWQEFLSKFILLFNTSYIASIEKTSINVSGKYPDFMLLNVYNYLDVFEIKKPNTKILEYDESRDNYYWSKELSKAIAQTENYLYELSKNQLAILESLRKKKKVDAKVINPQGFIIAGKSDEFKTEKMYDDFHLLSRGLKNIEVILYDQFLKNLKGLIKRL